MNDTKTVMTPRLALPGEVVSNQYGRAEFRLRDQELFGRTTHEHRALMRQIRMTKDTPLQRAALNESNTEERMTHAYVMGIFDTVKEYFEPHEFSTFLEAAWFFSEEFGWAAYRWQLDEMSGRYGYSMAWEQFLKYQPSAHGALARATARMTGELKA